METKTEIWKDIEGYEGIYQVSNFGRVRSLDHEVIKMSKHGKNTVFNIKGRILKGTTNWAGYKMVNIRHIDGKFFPRMVHRLVAKAFVPGYMEGLQVNHIDENKQNNRYDNLEWVTSKQNNNHGFHIERATAHCKEERKAIIQMSLNGDFVAEYPHSRDAQKATGIHRWQIRKCCENKPRYKTAGGYRWRYKE
jgi:hypothetical protein